MKFLLTFGFLIIASSVVLKASTCALLSKDSTEISRILELADISTLGDTDVEEFDVRIKEIRDLFVAAQDRRGLFATVYAVVTEGGLQELSKEGIFEDVTAMRRLIIEFAKTYLNSLRGYFGEDSDDKKLLKPQWKKYFEYAENFEVHPLFVLSTAINTHITLDLIDAILKSKMRASNEADYVKMGDSLIGNIDRVIDSLVVSYGVNRDSATALLKGFVLKNWKNEDGHSRFGNFSIHYLRNEAWEDAQDIAPWIKDESLPVPDQIEITSHHWKEKTEWWAYQQLFKSGVYFAKDGWSFSYSNCDATEQDEAVLKSNDFFEDLNEFGSQ
ncbi:MAG: DUF5995 family protein [bacterium]|nr:DUF5995 family protein [bacterium]